MAEESSEERQSEELQALEAIFPDQFVNCNIDSGEWKPMNVILTVVPQREQSGPLEAHVQIDLHVIASADYPNSVPQILLEKPKGLSDKLKHSIQQGLEKLATDKVGEVMVFELYCYIQKKLTECNKPSFESFYEEMMSKQKEKEIKEAEMQKQEEDIERQLLQLEIEGIKEKRKKFKGDIVDSPDQIHATKETPTSQRRKRTTSNDSIEDDTKSRSANMLNSVDWNSSLSSNSRLKREFEILKFIGRGAFGDVLQVRNILDDCVYAIKRIKLNQKNTQTNKKIMREVKLLRSLNHENIVRYYYSWLEGGNQVRRCSKETNSMDDISTECDSIVEGFDDDFQNNGHVDFGDEYKAPREVERKIKYKRRVGAGDLNLSFPRPNADRSFSDDESEDEDDDDCIEFLREDEDEPDGGDLGFLRSPDQCDMKIQNHYLYILMEYCEKQTLRDAIDTDLYLDGQKVWRLLREVVEGLLYIHQQGIIHRDLKPVNIFIDSEDHVKIGDFGLATPNKPKTVGIPMNRNTSAIENVVTEMGEGSYTGQIGTAFYVAPEVQTCASRVYYNQKVDIYSLGIIFFEMCYRPFSTQMERHKVLTNLRLRERIFPDDFYSLEAQKIKLIRALLNHNAAERPTAAEILDKEYIPPTEIENKKLLETIGHTLRNPQSKVYKHLIAECFNQKVSTAQDITFHDTSPPGKMAWQHTVIEKLSDDARKIFKLHGGIYFSTPFLLPSNNVGITACGAVSLMTRSGSLVNIPYDVRIAFARYLAQNPTISQMKKYSIDKVFREKRLLGSHPRELFECTFDIVSSDPCNLTMEAEILSIISEFLCSCSENVQKNCIILLNHVALVAAIFFHNHIETKRHVALCNFLNKVKSHEHKKLNKAKLSQLGLSTLTFESINQMMNVEILPNKMNSHFENFVKKSSACATNCKLALRQLDSLVNHLSSLQIKCPVLIAPSVISNFGHYSGIMFQVVWNSKSKNGLEKHVIAAGGRYDNLIAQFRTTLKITSNTTTKQSAVGLTIYFDKFINILQMDCYVFSTVDVLVCSMGMGDMMNEKIKLMQLLWNAEIRSTFLYIDPPLDEIQEYCEKVKISYIIFMKESEPGVLRLRSLMKDRFNEQKLMMSEIVPYLKKNIGNNGVNQEHPTTHHHYARSESRSTSVSHQETRKVYNSIAGSLSKVSLKAEVEVLVLDVEREFVKVLVSEIDLNTKGNNEMATLLKKY